MAQYVKATNFASKDALLSGDPNKIVKGAEVDDEFNNIQTAVNSKADTLSPTLTGTPLAPTATAGTNTTQVATTAFVTTAVTNGVTTERTATATLTNKTLTDALANTQAFGDSSTKIATTAFVQAALQAVYPVGSIYISTTGVNPSTTFGFGTWTEFGAGKVLVGQDAGDASFDTLEETGGSKNAIVVSHSHTTSASGTTSSAGSHSHGVYDPGHNHSYTYWTGYVNAGSVGEGFSEGGFATENTTSSGTGISIVSGGAHTHTISTSGTAATTGSSGTNANLQPYVVVKMWKRTA